MRVGFKHKGKSHRVDFIVNTTMYTDLIFIAKTSKDLDVIDELKDTDAGDRPIREGIKQMIEKQLKIDINHDWNYDGAGYGFNLDMYGIIKKLK